MAFTSLKRNTAHARMAYTAMKLRRADDEAIADRARQHLVTQMGKMRGLPQKVGQMLSFSGDDTESDNMFAELQESAEPLPLETAVEVIEEAWGRPLESVLQTIHPSEHTGSLGQVHRAITLDGREIAIKVQYPGIREAVMADLKTLGWLSIPVGNLKRGFDLASYKDTIVENLEQELDYLAEARQLREFHQWMATDNGLAVPVVDDELTTDNVLVTSWEEGDSWSTVRANWSDNEKRQAVAQMLQFFLRGMFIEGQIQADWHPGNFRFRRLGSQVQLLILDLGCVCRPTDEERLTLARLIQATIAGSESPWPLFLKLGFNREYLEPLADKLPALCRTLFEPFCVDHPYDLADWQLGDRVSDILGSDRLNFRIAGPAKLIFMLRAFHGLAFYAQGLGAPVRWQPAFQNAIAPLADAMAGLSLPQSEQDVDFASLSKHLKIRVQEHGRTKVALTSRAGSIEHLREMLPVEVLQQIKDRQIDLDRIVSDIRRRGYAPGPVFDLQDGDKDIEVFLE